ncbi:hypothetical protein BH09MYX1_BH09MYX1_37920 [soil metagenome]
MELASGLIVAERFRLDSELGKGGMGAVWAATHTVTKKQVALKFMHANSAELTARFVREAQTASAVRHPNVVEIHDVIPLPDGKPLMVMEMLTGESLAAKLVRERRLAPIETAQIMGPVVSAVAAAHAAGIVHRDLKPENIFLARYSTTSILPKVLDFGIAKLVGHNAGGQNESALTRTGSVLGTPYYMSPEQVFGEKDVDQRADIWALGVILYECICGQRPFEGDNFGQLLKSVTSGRFQPIETLAPWVSPQLAGVVVRMLRDRSGRLTDLMEVEHALGMVRGLPSGRSLPIPTTSQSAGAYTMTPPSGGFAAAYPQTGSGGYPVVSQPGPPHPSAQSSGGYSAHSGAHAAHSGGHAALPMTSGFGATGAAPSALTPSPMVSSQVMAPAPHDVPMQSGIGGKIAIAALAVVLLGGGVTLAARGLSGSRGAATGSAATTTATPVDNNVPLTTLSLPTLTEPASVVDAGGLAVPHASSGGASPHASASAAGASGSSNANASPSANANANANHGGGATGGLSTAVPF